MLCSMREGVCCVPLEYVPISRLQFPDCKMKLLVWDTGSHTGVHIKFSWELLEILRSNLISDQLNQNARVRPSCQYFSKVFQWL